MVRGEQGLIDETQSLEQATWLLSIKAYLILLAASKTGVANNLLTIEAKSKEFFITVEAIFAIHVGQCAC